VTRILDQLKEAGGIWSPNPDPNGDLWFMPWPCAAVRLRVKLD
jgi:hypothetical protein